MVTVGRNEEIEDRELQMPPFPPLQPGLSGGRGDIQTLGLMLEGGGLLLWDYRADRQTQERGCMSSLPLWVSSTPEVNLE